MFLEALMDEFTPELEKKSGKLDTDPHFWMPLTLSEKSYVEVMKQKGVEEGFPVITSNVWMSSNATNCRKTILWEYLAL